MSKWRAQNIWIKRRKANREALLGGLGYRDRRAKAAASDYPYICISLSHFTEYRRQSVQPRGNIHYDVFSVLVVRSVPATFSSSFTAPLSSIRYSSAVLSCIGNSLNPTTHSNPTHITPKRRRQSTCKLVANAVRTSILSGSGNEGMMGMIA